MKRVLIAGFLVAISATASFAAGGAASGAIVWADAGKSVVGGSDTAATAAKPIGKLSTGVAMAFKTDTGGYALITQHQSGVKAFGTSHDSTALYQKSVAKGDLTAAPGTANSADFVNTSNGWSSM